jgi:CDP-glycerol glycerophosphotransferase (TagB/SpsB family)
VNRVADALGDSHVLLLRGHRFHETPGSGARVLDVTVYPEINDLILAADAAVLDYSSLRFDFALTSRPMVFLVPDLEEYAGASRGFLYSFTDTAPGPLLSTTDEVVEALRDLSALSTEYAAALVRFNATYNSHQDGRAAKRVVDALEVALPGWDTLSR